MTNFSRIHAAVGELNAQRHATTVDGLSSISNASSETRPHEGNLNRLARELAPHRIVHNPFMEAEPESFERPEMAGAAGADHGRSVGDVDDRGLGSSEDNGEGQAAESSSREVSDAEEEEAPPLATPREPLGVSEEDFDIAVSDTPCSESGSGSGSEEPEPQLEADDGADSDDDPAPERIRHNLWDPASWGADGW
jgi:hypothetical protein